MIVLAGLLSVAPFLFILVTEEWGSPQKLLNQKDAFRTRFVQSDGRAAEEQKQK